MPEEDMPEVKVEGNYIVLEAIVGLDYGVCARTAVSIIQEVKEYSGNVELTNLSNKRLPEPRDAKSIMDIIMLAAAKGNNIRIRVEGTDENAKEKARRIYRGLTGTDSYDLRFDRS